MGKDGVPGGRDDTTAVFMISVAAELAGMHAQTLRTYDRLGLVTPHAPAAVAAATPRGTSNCCGDPAPVPGGGSISRASNGSST